MHMTETDICFLIGMCGIGIFGGIILVGWIILKIKQKLFNKNVEDEV